MSCDGRPGGTGSAPGARENPNVTEMAKNRRERPHGGRSCTMCDVTWVPCAACPCGARTVRRSDGTTTTITKTQTPNEQRAHRVRFICHLLSVARFLDRDSAVSVPRAFVSLTLLYARALDRVGSFSSTRARCNTTTALAHDPVSGSEVHANSRMSPIHFARDGDHKTAAPSRLRLTAVTARARQKPREAEAPVYATGVHCRAPRGH